MLHRLRTFWLLLLVSACTAPTPKTGCRDDAECGGGQECRQGQCVPRGAIACSADSDCNPADAALGLRVPGACEDLKCQDGLCAYPQRPTGSSCDDGSGCTVGDACKDGGCQPGAAKDCADGNPCSEDACDAATGACSHKANNAACDDGVACTLGDTCSGLTCVGQASDATCTDNNPCTDDSCDPGQGCQHVANTAACSDGDGCTSGDTCAGGSCQGGAATSCDDKNPCTTDSCAQGACQHVALDVGAACSLGAACQVGTCTAQHACNITGTAAGFCFIDATCRAAGSINPANSCQVCNAANQSAWSLAVDGTPCASDGVACTEDTCSAGTCQHVAQHSLCADKASACTSGVCDGLQGCVAVAADVTVSCNQDQDACTVEHCGAGNGVCESTGQQLGCDDGIACTLDACDPANGCGHTPQDAPCDDGNVCTADSCDVLLDCQHAAAAGACSLASDATCSADTCQAGSCQAGTVAGTCLIAGQCVAAGTAIAEGCLVCDPAQDAFAWSAAAEGTACSDGKACHVNQCQAGACNHGLSAGWCEIDGTCQLASAGKPGNPCLSCQPGVLSSAWSATAAGSACGSDGVACTQDQCDGAGGCLHLATDSLCAPTPQTCSVPRCLPAAGTADPVSGCAPVDACPVGHHCDAASAACLTDAPIPLITAGGDHPNPTNPAIFRHVLDPATGTTRLWVVFQTEACATASAGQWSLQKPAGLRAALVDSVVAAPADKATVAQAPVPVLTLPVANGWASASAVCQGYPVVARDPLSAGLGWLSWLEAAPGQPVACLSAAGQGGLLRLARLDGGALPAGGVWPAVAGDAANLQTDPLCTAQDAFLPSFLTAGFAVLPVAGADAAQKAVLSVRPSGASVNVAATVQQLRVGAMSANEPVSLFPKTGPFPALHPLLVDTGASLPSSERFLVLAINQKSSVSGLTWSLWATPLDGAGLDDAPVEWLKGTTPASGSGTGDLHDISAVCGLDAAVDAAGNVGVALVARRAGKDVVLLATRAPGAATASVSVLREQASADSSCAIGISAARIAGREDGDFVVQWLQSAGPTDVALGGVWLTSSANNTPVQLATLTAWDTDGAGPPLAWRGLGGLVAGPGGVVTTVLEGRTGSNRTLFLHSLKL